MSRLVSYSFCLLVAALVLYAFSPRGESESDKEPLNLQRVHINDLIRVGDRLVAVGERGTIVVSEDEGESWQPTHRDRQVPVTLTDISQISENVLLAVGHDSLVLRSEDDGSTWTQTMRDSELGEPLMGTWSADGERVYAFGSFGKFFISDDAGYTFEARELPIYGEHLSAMDGDEGSTRLIVGEMGLVLRSTDSGEEWEKLEPFYNGSLFGVAHMNGDRWVAYGMRGHVFYTGDGGDSWQAVDVPHELPLYGHTLSPSGDQLVIVGTAGTYVTVNDQGEFLETGSLGELGTLTSAVILPGGELFVAGQRGLTQGARSLVAAWNE